MWTGVIFFMVLIVFIWIYNIKDILNEPKASNEEIGLSSDWAKTKEEVSEKISEMKEGLEVIKEFAKKENETPNNFPSQATSTESGKLLETATTTEEAIDDEKLEEIKEKLSDELDIIQEHGYYYEMPGQVKDKFVENLETIKIGDSLDVVKDVLGEPTYNQKFYNDQGKFLTREVRYYIKIWEQDAVNEKYDQKVILEFDKNDILINIKKNFV